MVNAKLFLRLGLAFVFLYASISSFISPKDWIWYIPQWMLTVAPADFLLISHGITELLLAVWFLSGWKNFYAAVFAAADLLVITVINLEIMGIVFRDVGLIFAALALASLLKEEFTLFQKKA